MKELNINKETIRYYEKIGFLSEPKKDSNGYRLYTQEDVDTISSIYALSWKYAYKDIVPQRYLDELKCDFCVSEFQNWISNGILIAQLICENEIPVGCVAYGKSRDAKFANWGETNTVECFILNLYIYY